jgi:hypothetical protein
MYGMAVRPAMHILHLQCSDAESAMNGTDERYEMQAQFTWFPGGKENKINLRSVR